MSPGNRPLAGLLWGEPGTFTLVPSAPTLILMQEPAHMLCQGWMVHILGFVGHISSLCCCCFSLFW